MDGFKDEVGEFTVYRKFPSMAFLGQNVSRLAMNICGGKAAVFTSEVRVVCVPWAKHAGGCVGGDRLCLLDPPLSSLSSCGRRAGVRLSCGRRPR